MTHHSFPTVDAFRSADPGKLRVLYDGLFARIHEKERSLRVFASVQPRISRILEDLDACIRRFPDAQAKPPLFGVPVGVKALFRMTGYPTRCGSLLPSDLFEGPESAIVSLLRESGAIPLALTATAEFGSPEPPATANPHNLAHTPGGSSSGSAAGVAAGFFPLAVGSQTIGSVIRPAAYCGVTGFKPSFGVLPTKGQVYFSRSADHVGLFTATPAEMSAVFHALMPERRAEAVTYTMRLGVPVGPYLDQAQAEALAHFNATLKRLAGQKVEIVEVPCLEDITGIAERHHDMISAEFAEEHSDYFVRYEALYRPRTAEMLRHGQKQGRAAAERGNSSQRELRERLQAKMNEHGLHAWVSPAAVGEAEKGLLSTGDPCMNMPWTHAGVPVLTFPTGRGSQNLPLGIQLAGAFGEDDALLAVGCALHDLLAH